MTGKQKFDCALALRRAILVKKQAERQIADLSAQLASYVEQTGDSVFEWPGKGLSLTYVRGTAPGTTTDWKRFVELAAGFMSANDYETLLKRCTKRTAGRKPSFR